MFGEMKMQWQSMDLFEMEEMMDEHVCQVNAMCLRGDRTRVVVGTAQRAYRVRLRHKEGSLMNLKSHIRLHQMRVQSPLWIVYPVK